MCACMRAGMGGQPIKLTTISRDGGWRIARTRSGRGRGRRGYVLSTIPDTPVGTQVLAGLAHCLSSPLPFLASSPLPSQCCVIKVEKIKRRPAYCSSRCCCGSASCPQPSHPPTHPSLGQRSRGRQAKEPSPGEKVLPRLLLARTMKLDASVKPAGPT